MPRPYELVLASQAHENPLNRKSFGGIMGLVFRTDRAFLRLSTLDAARAWATALSTSCGKTSQGGAISSRSNAPKAYCTRARIPICLLRTGLVKPIRNTQHSALSTQHSRTGGVKSEAKGFPK